MSYVSGFVVPVPVDRKEDYRKMAEEASGMFRGYGALEMMEAWGDNVPDGAVTDFRRAVQAKENETVVFAWIVWPDKATADAAEKAMMADDGMPDDAPFDMKRMIFGGFVPLFQMGREAAP